MTKHDEFPLFFIWKEFLMWLLKHTEKFPKRVRFTISSRILKLSPKAHLTKLTFSD